MTTVDFDAATRFYPGTTKPAVDRLTLHVDDGEFLVLVGPSGSGKSTALRMLAGLENVDAGKIWIGDHDVTNVPPKDRDIAMVFQNYALYPHMTVNENLSFPLKVAHVPSAQIQHRVHEVASVLDIEQLLDRKPRALSGGQRQRVAMGRAIVRSPHVFLMDEPLSNLDAKLRTQTRTQIAALQRRLEVTTVYVTHDQVEAMTMGDRVAVLRDGVLQQVGAPKDLYEQPDNMFVAGFMGSPAMNLLELPATDGDVHFGDFFYPVERDTMTGSGSRVVLGVRPEDLEPDEHGLAFEVEAVEVLGADAYVYGRAVGTGDANNPVNPAPGQAVDADGNAQLIVRTDGHHPPAKGQTLHLAPRPGSVHLFDLETGRTFHRATTGTR